MLRDDYGVAMAAGGKRPTSSERHVSPRSEPESVRPLTAERVKTLLREGQQLRHDIEARYAPLHVLTADDLKSRSR
jgi:hypothetical protein